VITIRGRLTKILEELGFSVIPSSANFVLAKSDKVGGFELYNKLKERGVLVRYFNEYKIKDYVRITVGTDEDTDILISKIREILKEKI
ncbi:MAG: aminotransferase class I/II-fold pyridoxal phosphate-dependent enzyme, partial [Candidatus Coproplasma sp.]